MASIVLSPQPDPGLGRIARRFRPQRDQLDDPRGRPGLERLDGTEDDAVLTGEPRPGPSRVEQRRGLPDRSGTELQVPAVAVEALDVGPDQGEPVDAGRPGPIGCPEQGDGAGRTAIGAGIDPLRSGRQRFWRQSLERRRGHDGSRRERHPEAGRAGQERRGHERPWSPPRAGIELSQAAASSSG